MNYRDLNIKISYHSQGPDNITDRFICPALKCTKLYRRATGFFSSSVLSSITDGVRDLITNDGKIHLIASPRFSQEDIDAINAGYRVSAGALSGMNYVSGQIGRLCLQ